MYKFDYKAEYGPHDQAPPLQESLAARIGVQQQQRQRSDLLAPAVEQQASAQHKVALVDTPPSSPTSVGNNRHSDHQHTEGNQQHFVDPVADLFNHYTVRNYDAYNNGEGVPSQRQANHHHNDATTPQRYAMQTPSLRVVDQHSTTTDQTTTRSGGGAPMQEPVFAHEANSLLLHRSPMTPRMLNPQRQQELQLGARDGAAAAISNHVSSPHTHWHGIPNNSKMTPYNGQPVELSPSLRKSMAKAAATAELGHTESSAAMMNTNNSNSGAFANHLTPTERRLHTVVEAFNDAQLDYEERSAAEAAREEARAFAEAVQREEREREWGGADGTPTPSRGVLFANAISPPRTPTTTVGGTTGSHGSTIVYNPDPNAPLFTVAPSSRHTNGPANGDHHQQDVVSSLSFAKHDQQSALRSASLERTASQPFAVRRASSVPGEGEGRMSSASRAPSVAVFPGVPRRPLRPSIDRSSPMQTENGGGCGAWADAQLSPLSPPPPTLRGRVAQSALRGINETWDDDSERQQRQVGLAGIASPSPSDRFSRTQSRQYQDQAGAGRVNADGTSQMASPSSSAAAVEIVGPDSIQEAIFDQMKLTHNGNGGVGAVRGEEQKNKKPHPFSAPTTATGPYGFRHIIGAADAIDESERIYRQQQLNKVSSSTPTPAYYFVEGMGRMAQFDTHDADPMLDQHHRQHQLSSYQSTINAAIKEVMDAAKGSTRQRAKREEEEDEEETVEEKDALRSNQNSRSSLFFNASSHHSLLDRSNERLLAGERGAAIEMQPREHIVAQTRTLNSVGAPDPVSLGTLRGFGLHGSSSSANVHETPRTLAANRSVVDDTIPRANLRGALTSFPPPEQRGFDALGGGGGVDLPAMGDLSSPADLKKEVIAVAHEVLRAEMAALVAMREAGVTTDVAATSPLALLVKAELHRGQQRNVIAHLLGPSSNSALRADGTASSSPSAGTPIAVQTTPDARHSFLNRQIGPSPLDRASLTPPTDPSSSSSSPLDRFDAATRRIIEGPHGGKKRSNVEARGNHTVRGFGEASSTIANTAASVVPNPNTFHRDLTRYLGDTHEGVRAGAAFDSMTVAKILAAVVEAFVRKHTVLTTRLPLSTALQAEIGTMVRQEMLRASVTYGRLAEEPLFFGDIKRDATGRDSSLPMGGEYSVIRPQGSVVDAKAYAADRLSMLKALNAERQIPTPVWIPGESYKKAPPVADGPMVFNKPVTVPNRNQNMFGGGGTKKTDDVSGSAGLSVEFLKAYAGDEDLRTVGNVMRQHPAAVALAADLAMNKATVVISEPTFTYEKTKNNEFAADPSKAAAPNQRQSISSVVIIASVDREMDDAVRPPVWSLSVGNQFAPATLDANARANDFTATSTTGLKSHAATPIASTTGMATLSVESLVKLGRARTSQVLKTREQSVFVLEILNSHGAVLNSGQQYTVWFKPTPSSTASESRTFWMP